MDVLVLIDKLDDLIHNARPVPLTDQVRVDREEIYDLLDQMRATIPEEIKQARWIVKERQEMLAEAKREAERVVKEARDQQARLISDEEVYKQAERAAEDIVEDARVVAILDRLLQPGYLLTASQAICIHPGESAQPIHHDDSFYPVPRPRPSYSYSTIVAVDDFTAENGGTEVIPGSHRWSDAQIEGHYDGRQHERAMPASLESRLVPMVVPAGTCILFHGTLMHRGGANRSSASRLAFSNQYCEPWARTQENFFLGLPPERTARMSPRLQVLLGYEVMPPFMGHVTASHPRKVLQPGYVNALIADDQL